MNPTDLSASPVSLRDSDLTQHLITLVRHERRHIVEFLRHLAEFDSRRLYLGLGYSSVFVYCRDGLKLSNASSYRRHAVARLMNRFPVIAGFLEDGRLNLTRVARLETVLTAENHLDVLARASLGSEDDVKVLVATLKPRPDATDSVRKAPTRTNPSKLDPAPEPAPAQLRPSTTPAGSAAELPDSPTPPDAPAAQVQSTERQADPFAFRLLSSAAELRVPAPKRMEVEPTSATAYCVRMRVGPEFLEEFEAVKAALSHKFPEGNFEDVLRECMRVTLEAIDRRRAAKTSRCGTAEREQDAPAPTKPEAATSDEASTKRRPSRYIPAAVRRAVWKRDGGRCAFVSADGKRCDSRHQLEIHHKDPFALGGASTEMNLSLRCRSHNAYEAELAFGADFMRSKTSDHQRRSKLEPAVPQRNSNRPGLKSTAQAVPDPDPEAQH